ncbi:hypothetical protein RUM43_008489, partial [Polyplax serrata]
GNSLSEEFLTTLRLEKLPEKGGLNHVLMVSSEPRDTLAVMAEKILKHSSMSSIAQINQPPTIDLSTLLNV